MKSILDIILFQTEFI